MWMWSRWPVGLTILSSRARDFEPCFAQLCAHICPQIRSVWVDLLLRSPCPHTSVIIVTLSGRRALDDDAFVDDHVRHHQNDHHTLDINSIVHHTQFFDTFVYNADDDNTDDHDQDRVWLLF